MFCVFNITKKMSESCTGEDLLDVFKNIKVQLLNLNPNVIKGWFDTDDQDIKNLLSWMCTSLTAENYMPPLELAEYNDIETPLSGVKYDQELMCLKSKYPGILDPFFTELDIEILEDELKLITEEEQRLDNLISIHEDLQVNLQKELSEKTEKEIAASLVLKETQERCCNLAEKMDEVNAKHYQQLQDYGEDLYNFDLDTDTNFISNMDPEVFQKMFNILTTQLSQTLEDNMPSINATSILNKTSLSIDDTLANNVSDIKHRISSSLQNYMISNIEKEKVSEMLNYICNLGINDLIMLPEKSSTPTGMESKEEIRNRMYCVLEEIANKMAEHETSLTKLKYTQQELKIKQEKIEHFSKIEEMLKELLSYYLVLNVLYNEENADIQKIDSYFKSIYQYAKGKDFHDCVMRIDWMTKMIEEYKSRPENNDFKLIQSIVKIISNEENVSLERAFQIVTHFKKELQRIEKQTFDCNTDYKSVGKNVQADVEVLQSFLISGPTVKIVVIPNELQLIFRETEEILKKQKQSVKTAVELTSSMKKRFKVKWELYRRQLWMYFLADPQKLKFALHQIQEEFAKSKPKIEEK